MLPEDAARASAGTVAQLPAGFMFDAATYAEGGRLGFEGVDFYYAGRGGALGDVDGAVVAATFVFFHPAAVAAGWDRSRAVMGRAEANAAFCRCLAAWAEDHLVEGMDWGRLAVLADRVLAAASPAAAPLFVAWRALPEPAEPRALALHRLDVLRELRGAVHGAAVLASGLEPLEAVLVRAPFMAGILGWPEPYPDVTLCRAAWEGAEAATDRVLARPYAALEAAELDEFVDLLAQAQASAT